MENCKQIEKFQNKIRMPPDDQKDDKKDAQKDAA